MSAPAPLEIVTLGCRLNAAESDTLGCRLNAAESEAMRAAASAAELGDAIIVNTCAVTAEAVRRLANHDWRRKALGGPARALPMRSANCAP